MSEPEERGSVVALLSRLSKDAIDLASAELTLAKAEASYRAREVLLGLVPLTVMLVFLGVGTVTLTVGLILALGSIVGHATSALIIGGVEVFLALGAAAVVRTRFLRAVADPAEPDPSRLLPSPEEHK